MMNTKISDLRSRIGSNIYVLNLKNRLENLDAHDLRSFLSALEPGETLRGPATDVPENLSHDMDGIWARYVNACLERADRFEVNGGEYDTLLRRRYSDPRAAAAALDLRLSVVPDGRDMGRAPELTDAARRLSAILIEGIRHEIACLRWQGSIPGYPDNVLERSDEDWSLYTFAHQEYTAQVPDYVRTVRSDMLRIPDYSNVVELPEEELLEKAN